MFICQIFSPACVIFTGVGILLSVRIPFNIRALAHCNGLCLSGIAVYTEVEPTPEMMDIMVQITVEVLSILGIATKEIRQSRTSE